jgi:hypothetical protein
MQYTRSFVDYMRYLCQKNALLKHQDTVGNKVFAVINLDEANGDFRTGASDDGYIFRLIVPKYSIAGDASDPRKEWTGMFLIAKLTSDRSDSDLDKIDALSLVDSIGDTFALRMSRDSQAGHPLFNHSVDDITLLKFMAIPKLYTSGNYQGRLFSFSLQNAYTTCDNKMPHLGAWMDTGTTPF